MVATFYNKKRQRSGNKHQVSFSLKTALLLKGKKEDLIALAKQFGVTVETDLTKPKTKDLILKSGDYDEEDAKVMLEYIIEDRLLAEVEKQNEREERLRKEEREHELQKLKIQAQRNVGHENSADISVTNKASQEMFHRFNMKDDISLNLTLFEHHANLTLLPKAQWVQKLLGSANFRDGNNKFEKRPLQQNRNSYVEKNKVETYIIPKRYILTAVALAATTLSIALQTNLSLAIVYMVEPDFDGNISSSTSNECSAVRNVSTHTEKSLFTTLSPIAAEVSVYFFMFVRIMVGLGAAPVFPLLVIMISKWIPSSEQNFIASIMLAGYGTGAFVSYLVSGVLCSSEFLGGWPSVFYLSGNKFYFRYRKNGLLSCVPNLLRALFACFVGSIIDWARRRRDIPIVYVRKGATLVNSITACLGFTGVLFAGCDAMLNTVAFILGGLCGDFAIFGVSLVPTDIAPSLGGTLSGILCFFGSTPYFVLPYMIGMFTKKEQSLRQWRYIYYCTIGVTVVTTLIYVIFGTSDPQPWATEDEGVSSKQKESQERNEQTLSKSNTNCNTLEYQNNGFSNHM
ncbi:Sialin like protein [Argiope bruennichi]|uniref:Sialin like protein n=1 Tax=Argiope bruennichi TaxID=94029 RepID=A0A8T0EIV6_ARGBR|nr:Sialin like protein [Argiope bruennichi]